MDALQGSGHQSVTLAPETGTERLRQVVKKNMTDDEIIEAAVTATTNGIPNLRFYFLIGLPTETMEDVEQIVYLAKRIKHAILSANKKKEPAGQSDAVRFSFCP